MAPSSQFFLKIRKNANEYFRGGILGVQGSFKIMGDHKILKPAAHSASVTKSLFYSQYTLRIFRTGMLPTGHSAAQIFKGNA